MKTLKLKMETKNRLDIFADGLSSNKAMRKLLEDAREEETVVECNKRQEYYNIKIDDDLLDKLERCRKYSNESQSDIVERLLNQQGADD